MIESEIWDFEAIVRMGDVFCMCIFILDYLIFKFLLSVLGDRSVNRVRL